MGQPISFLDLSPVPNGLSAHGALEQSVQLARLAEDLGFQRVWYAEHHNSAGLASAVPAVLIAHIAAHTERIRLGSGGVMLPNHSSLAIAEQYRLLEALHPGRIDLGMGRAPGTDSVTAFAMRRSREALTADDYPEQLQELLAFDDGTFAANHPFRSIRPIPVGVSLPPIFLLGSSDFSGRLAAETGLGFAFAAHINMRSAIPAMRDYRARFTPSSRYPEPWAILAVSVTIGETEAHARQLSLLNDLFSLRLATGQLSGPMPTLADALAHQFTDEERRLIERIPMNAIVGTAETVKQRVDDLAANTDADEIMFTTIMPELADRKRALIDLARVYGLADAAGITYAEPVIAL